MTRDELIRTLETAAGGDPDLDVMVCGEITRDPQVLDYVKRNGYRVTDSLDAALSLFIPHLKIKMTLRADGRGYACVWRHDGTRSAHAATLPLALCIVALKP